MKLRFFLLALTLALTLFANEYNDEDLDGVPDYMDRCPNTPFSDIVDEYGCSIERLIRPKKFEYFFEYIYATNDDRSDFKENDYLFGFSIYKGNFDLSVNSFYYDNKKKAGFSDTNIKLEYRFTPTPMWDIYVAAGVELPTYNMHGNRVDYDFYLSSEYYFLGYKFFGGVYLTKTTDRFHGKRLDDSYGGYLGWEFYHKKYTFDLVYLYNKSKFDTISNMGYIKLERILKHNYYIYTTYTHGFNEAAIDSIFSVGFGRRF